MMNANYLVLPILLLCLAGCSLPRIIVLNDPLDARQHNDLGVTYEHRTENDLALREYQRASAIDSSWALPLFNMGNVYARMQQWPDAVAAYEAALELEPESPAIMNNLAWALVESGELDRGVSLAEETVVLDSTNPTYWDTLASAYQAASRPKEAGEAARKGLSLSPPPDLRTELKKKLDAPGF